MGIFTIDLNAAEIRTVPDHLCTKNLYEWEYIYIVLKLESSR